MKQRISGIASFFIVSLSIYLIWRFFQDYKVIYLVTAIIFPIILLFISSQYCVGNFVRLIVVVGGGAGYFYFKEPMSTVSASVAAYLILFKIVRYGNTLSGNYIDVSLLENYDFKYLNSLLNSTWYEQNINIEEDQISIESLKSQPFFKKYVEQIIDILIRNNFYDYRKSEYTTEILKNIFAIATKYTITAPATKNANGIISNGTQLLINIFSNIKAINKMQIPDLENKDIILNSLVQLNGASEEKYGKVTEEELEQIRNNKM